MNEENRGFEFDWDSEIENDGGEFIVLPAGDYDFTVTGFERGLYEPKQGAKLPPCKMATLTLSIETEQGTVNIRDNLYLHSKCEGMLCSFFAAIGQRKHGERVRMNWGAVLGAKGRAKIYIDTFTGNDGQPHQNNKVKKYYDYDESKLSQRPQAQSWVQDAMRAPDVSAEKKWKPGEF